MTDQRYCFSSLTLILTTLLLVTLTACSSNGKKWNPDDYTVKSGDTLYAIAWRYELDVDELAAWNELGAASLIKPGQRLHTRKPTGFRTSSLSRASQDTSNESTADRGRVSQPSVTSLSEKKWVKARKGDSLYSISKRSGVSIERLAKLNQLKPPYTILLGQTVFLRQLNAPVKLVTNSAAKKAKTASTVTTPASALSQADWPGVVRWQRPAKGKVIKNFNRQRNDAKGISIAGKMGEPIVAAADGKVVYSGDGLISYGNLIIIKHNKTFLSAYAYNSKLLVQEGDRVKSGQKIAKMGRKDRLSPRLHFEIRKNGKPVDPLKYLP